MVIITKVEKGEALVILFVIDLQFAKRCFV